MNRTIIPHYEVWVAYTALKAFFGLLILTNLALPVLGQDSLRMRQVGFLPFYEWGTARGMDVAGEYMGRSD